MSAQIRRRLAIVVPAVAVLLGWWFLAWQPASDADVAASERRDAADRRALALQAELRSATDFAAGGRDSDDALEAARDAVPGDADLDGFLRLHDDLAASTGVVVESLAPAGADARKDPSTPSGLRDTRVAVTVSGSATAASDYLAGLAELRRQVVVDHIAESTSGGDVRLDLEIRIFHRARAGLLSS